MPYLFSRRRLRSTDVLDPVEMNQDFQPAAEKYSGRLNAHDFNGALMKANAAVASRAYYQIGHVFRSVSPGYAHGTSAPTTAGGGPDAVFTLLNDRSWHLIDDMAVTLTTGVSSLWIIGWVQYGWNAQGSVYYVDTFLQANVQFAISVDGHIVEATLTGQRESYERTWLPVRPLQQWNNTSGAGQTAFPGPGRVQLGETPAGIGHHHKAVRLGCAYPVQPGSHVIRILARRAARASPAGVFVPGDDTIIVYSRRLFVLDAPQFPRAASALSTTDVVGLEPEDGLTAAAMGASRATAVRDAYNSVAAGAVGRGAFRNEHLPSVVRASQIATFGTGVAQSTDNLWPGYNTSTFAAAPNAGTGWWELTDNVGVTLRLTNGGVGWNRANGTILLLGNVLVDGVINQTAPPSGDFRHYGVLSLGYSVGGVRTVIGATEAGVNSFNLLEDNVALNLADRQIEADVPLLFVHEPSDTVLPAGTLDHFTVFGSELNGTPAVFSRNNLSWNAASFIAIQLRD